MSQAIRCGAVGYALDPCPHWRRLRSAPVALMAVLLAAVAGAAGAAGPKAAVLELRVAVGGVPADFGLAGARMLARALQATGQYEVIDHETVEGEVRQRGLRPPFAVGHLQLLADALAADIMVHGSVRGLTYDSDAGSASVILSIELVDGRSGQLKQRQQASGTRSAEVGVRAGQQEVLVGALASAVEVAVEALTGQKATAALKDLSETEKLPDWVVTPALLPPMEVASDTPKTGEPRDDLAAVSEAPPQPVVAVVRGPGVGISEPEAPPREETPATEPREVELQPPVGGEDDVVPGGPPLVEAKVLAKLGPDRVLITLGKDAIVEPKMELEVFRARYSRDTEKVSKSRIGKLRVVKINPTDAEARILEGAGLIRTGDLAYYYGP